MVTTFNEFNEIIPSTIISLGLKKNNLFQNQVFSQKNNN